MISTLEVFYSDYFIIISEPLLGLNINQVVHSFGIFCPFLIRKVDPLVVVPFGSKCDLPQDSFVLTKAC